MSHCILVTGGIRSGKSRFAQELAEKAGGRVLFVATAEARDAEMRERIARHRKVRPSSWRTLEVTGGVGEALRQGLQDSDTVLLDCLDMLITNILDRHACTEDDCKTDYRKVESELDAEMAALEKLIRASKATFIIVTSEVGMGLVSLNRMGRCFQDLLGLANQRMARSSGEVYFMVSGIPLTIKP